MLTKSFERCHRLIDRLGFFGALPVRHVRGHAERRSFHTGPGAIVQYWHVTPPRWEPFVRECKTPKCVESLDSRKDASTKRTPKKKRVVVEKSGNWQFRTTSKPSI